MNAEPRTIASLADVHTIAALPIETQWQAPSLYALLCETADAHAERPAISFQLRSGPRDRASTLSWAAFRKSVTQAANLFHSLGIGPQDTVAFLLPNTPDTAITLIGGMTAGIVAPINPLLEAEQIAAILRETGARVLVTLKPFVKTDIAQKAAYAVRNAPDCKVILEVDMTHHLDAPLRWVVPFLTPRRVTPGSARVLDFAEQCGRQRGDALDFAAPADPDAICAYFHTGGTTGAPKVAVHRHRGALYNAWLGKRLLMGLEDCVLCPLPLFHVLAAYPMLASCIASGAHFVMPTPAGYRGEGVMENFWKLCARWRCSFFATVPTAVAALMQRPIDADVSSLNYALCGSAPMPAELFRRFEAATGMKVLEGYGQTETTCMIACNPPAGARKIGSVGLPLPYSEVAIRRFTNGTFTQCGVDEIGEICVANVGVTSGYLDPSRNPGLFAEDGLLRTGDLGRIDGDGYLWITGRSKDLIIRGGHNIDPAVIEDALMAHEDVTFVGAVAQPDAYAGELPCAFVELREGAHVTADALRSFASDRVSERAARPVHVEIMTELPKTAVGKIYKPTLRARAMERVYTETLSGAKIAARVICDDDPKLGMVAHVTVDEGITDEAIGAALKNFARPWLRR